MIAVVYEILPTRYHIGKDNYRRPEDLISPMANREKNAFAARRRVQKYI